MDHHWHAYHWNIAGNDINDHHGRADSPGFPDRDHPANEQSAYLRKNPRFIRRTFNNPHDALDWFTQQYRTLPPPLRPDHTPLTPPDDPTRLANALHTLTNGHDLTWTFWAAGTRRITLNLIRCPNRNAPTLPCPLRTAATHPAPHDPWTGHGLLDTTTP